MNNSATYKVLGVMSGTSLDGIDLANCELTFRNNTWEYIITECITINYTRFWKEKLIEAFNYSKEDLKILNKEYATFLSEVIKQHANKWDFDYISSHGHTILHQPENGITIQIGDGQHIANLCKKTVIYDFRSQDVELGGQGAPLVPIGDQLLFNNIYYRINLGGFANISFEHKNSTTAFDICPVNFVLNEYAQKLGKDYDESGLFAESGTLIPSLLSDLNDLEYYQKSFPKSMGREWVEKYVFPLLLKHTNCNDILKTFTEHIAFQISEVITPNKSILFTGGGTYNTFLIDRIKHFCPSANIVSSNNETIEFKEALIFSLLGVLKLRNETNVLASVTGANQNHCSGKIAIPKHA